MEEKTDPAHENRFPIQMLDTDIRYKYSIQISDINIGKTLNKSLHIHLGKTPKRSRNINLQNPSRFNLTCKDHQYPSNAQ